MPEITRSIVGASHTFPVEVLRLFRGHPFTLVFETLREKGFPVRARDGLLIPETGYTLSIKADKDTVTYWWSRVEYSLPVLQDDPPGQLDDGV